MFISSKFLSFCCLLGILLACSQDSQTQRLLDEYPLLQTALDQQTSDLNQLVVTDHRGKKKLAPGIYCARILYPFGDYGVGSLVLKDGAIYGAQADTIEVEITQDDTLNYISALIVNGRKEIIRLPKDSTTETIGEEEITFLRSNYHARKDDDPEESPFFGTYRVLLNHQMFYRYFISIFAKGGQCANTLSTEVPGIESTLAVNLKHEALRPEAEARYYESAKAASSKVANSYSIEDKLNDERNQMNMSQDDYKYYQEQQQEKYDRRMDHQIDLEEKISHARSRPTLLRGKAPVVANRTDQPSSGGIWDAIKHFFSKGESKTLTVNSMSDATDITVKKGDELSFIASGQITLGFFAGSCDPNGIAGFESYSKVQALRHGCLMGRIGSGEWFEVGLQKSIVAQSDGPLQLQVNDGDPSNNSGNFTVECTLSR